MNEGTLVAIYIVANKRADLEPVEQVEAVAGQGLRGDRYFRSSYGGEPLGKPDQEVTLIELEAIEAARREFNIDLQPGQTRRNLITESVSLNRLVGQEFYVGEVLLRGLELCHPCKHLEMLTCAGMMKALKERGGLRAEVITGGSLRPGNVIRPRLG